MGWGGGGGRNWRFVLINRGCHRSRYRWGGLGFWVSGDRGSLAGRALSLAGSLLPVVMSGAGCPVIRWLPFPRAPRSFEIAANITLELGTTQWNRVAEYKDQLQTGLSSKWTEWALQKGSYAMNNWHDTQSRPVRANCSFMENYYTNSTWGSWELRALLGPQRICDIFLHFFHH